MASNEQTPRRARPGPWPPGPSSSDRNQPHQPLSWAKRTGFKGRVSGETNISSNPNSGIFPLPRPSPSPTDLESGRSHKSAQLDLTPPPPVRASTPTPPPPPLPPVKHNSNANTNSSKERGISPPIRNQTDQPSNRQRRESDNHNRPNGNHHHHDNLPQEQDDQEHGFSDRHSHINYKLRDSPGLVPIMIYGLQHYLSMMGSLILTPLIMVPAMGGSNDDTAQVVSTILFVTGVTTLLHTFFGTRLPLVQGPSFIYLAPVLAIINSREFQALNQNKFNHIMKELQGALIISSAFQSLIGYTGFMSLFLKLINPVVVSSTIAAVGLSFFTYGFTRVGLCIEIGALQILLLVIFSLYLRKIKLFGYRVFLIYAVPLGLGITWLISFILTETGAYSYKGCDPNIPASNTVSEYCRKHITRTKYCRVDTIHTLRSAPWFRFPYPFQWGTPIFDFKLAFIMCFVSIISSVDSVGTYHASSLLVATRPPTRGVVSRGIGMEGLSTLLSGLCGTGIGSATLTENIHTIAITKMGNRIPVQFGAIILILISLIGKVGGFIASIPETILGGLICFIFALLVAIGLSNLRYTPSWSSRNSIIVGLAVFLSLSVPAYVAGFGSVGPVGTGFGGVDYVVNLLVGCNVVIGFVVALVLDNTVPAGGRERGVYIWSEREGLEEEDDGEVVKDYALPFGIGRVFRWVKWVGV